MKDDGSVPCGMMFSSLEGLQRHVKINKLTLDLYHLAYTGNIDKQDTMEALEEIFVKFQGTKPKGFDGRSVSMSDIVQIEDRYFYCDSYGWQQIDIMKTPNI